MLVSLNNYNRIHFTNKATRSEEFDEVHQVVIDRIIYNMASLVYTGKYGAINAEDTTTLGYYIVNYVSEPFTLQYDITAYGHVSNAGELVAK